MLPAINQHVVYFLHFFLLLPTKWAHTCLSSLQEREKTRAREKLIEKGIIDLSSSIH